MRKGKASYYCEVIDLNNWRDPFILGVAIRCQVLFESPYGMDRAVGWVCRVL